MDPTPKLLITPLEQEPKILSFEEFSFRKPSPSGDIDVPRYNNFYLYFTGWDKYTKRKHYEKFAFEHRDMAESLTGKIQNLKIDNWINPKFIEPFDEDFYEAYVIMRSYGASDKELFA